MPIDQIVALLVAERDRLNRAIEALQGPSVRRGRPPKNTVTAAPGTPKTATRKRRAFTAAQRAAAAERMRQRWAAKRKADAKVTSKTKRTAKAA